MPDIRPAARKLWSDTRRSPMTECRRLQTIPPREFGGGNFSAGFAALGVAQTNA